MRFLIFFTTVLIVLISVGCSTAGKKESGKDKNLQLLEENTVDGDPAITKAKQLLMDENFDGAIKVLKSAASKDSLFYLGLAYYGKGDTKNGVNYFTLAVAENIYKDESFYNLGLISYENGDAEKASEFMENAVKNNPSHAGALYFLGSYWYMKADFEKSISFYEKVTKVTPAQYDGWNGLFLNYIAIVDYSKAWNIRDNIDRESPDLVFNVAIIGEKLGNYREALDYIEKTKVSTNDIKYQKIILSSKSGAIDSAVDLASKLISDLHEAKEFLIIDRMQSDEMTTLVYMKRDKKTYLACRSTLENAEKQLVIKSGGVIVQGEKREFGSYKEFTENLVEICKK